MIHLSEAEYAALRAQVASMAALLEALGEGQPTGPPECPHVNVENEGTFGAPVMRCQDCRQLV